MKNEEMTLFDNETLWPQLQGEPAVGQWYEIPVEGALCFDGSPWHGMFRKGRSDCLLVWFFGGGVSISEETTRLGGQFFSTSLRGQDYVAQMGIGSDRAENPFRDWSCVAVPYASGDFHVGCGTCRYRENGEERTVYHHGFRNYSGLMDCLRPLLGAPEKVLIAGFSAGAFGAALLADDLLSRFPSAKSRTVCIDSALMIRTGWRETVRDLWQAPPVIWEKLTTEDLVTDSLAALSEKYGDDLSILFDCSYRDFAFSAFQSYIDTGVRENTQQRGDVFHALLCDMVRRLQKEVKNIGIFIWNYNEDPDNHNTQHTVLPRNLFDPLDGDVSVCDWIRDAVEGRVYSCGLELLQH